MKYIPIIGILYAKERNNSNYIIYQTVSTTLLGCILGALIFNLLT